MTKNQTLKDIWRRVTCARCGRHIESVDYFESEDGRADVFVFRCHGESETHEIEKGFLQSGEGPPQFVGGTVFQPKLAKEDS
jgi:hypothetical protein